MIAFARPWMLLALFSVPTAALLSRGVTGRRGALVLRAAALALLALAAAGPRVQAPSDKVTTMFVLDVSDSMGRRGIDDGLDYINDLLEGVTAEDEAGLVTVAASAAAEIPPRPGNAPFRAELRHDRTATRLAEGIYTAVGAMGRDEGERRIVLVSDGRDDGGGLEEAVAFAAGSGIRVDALPVGDETAREVSVVRLIAPERIAEGDVHALTVVIRSTDAVAARLLIARDGVYVGEDRLQLRAGTQRQRYEMPAPDPGNHTYEVILDVATDPSPENNRGLALTTVEGERRILWVGEGNSAVPSALEAQGRIVDRIAPGELPDTLSGYSRWDAVILDNVSARELSLRTLDILETWVRTRGGGLMMIGGDASFGLGGWKGTPVERALPVDMDAPSSLYIPSLTMVLVIDKSGSMGGNVDETFSKLDLVKDAVLGAVGLLNPLYSVGLLAFDADVEWTIPVTEAGNASEIRRGLAGLESGGGTVLYPAVREAYERLAASPSEVRHLVILSDGLSEPADFEALAAAIVRDGITMSTVAVGADADAELMALLADRGGGRYWYAEDATQVPRIFASESMIVSQGLTVNETIFPVPVMTAEALAGIDLTLVPPLHGYVMTYPNPAATEALRSPRGHPILVYGPHGLGRGVVFTSDLRGSWGRDWAAWDGLPRLLAQSVRWMSGGRADQDVSLSMDTEGGSVRLVLEARSPEGGFRIDLKPVGRISTPDGREFPVNMIQASPGRYEGYFRPDDDGVYEATAIDEAAGVSETARWARAYSPETAQSGVDTAVLAGAARIGGGRLLNRDINADTWWRVRADADRTVVDLTRILALAALLLFTADIALRESSRWGRHETGGAGRGAGPEMDMERLILKGLDEERHKPKFRRPTPAEAARILAERRQRRERDQR